MVYYAESILCILMYKIVTDIIYLVLHCVSLIQQIWIFTDNISGKSDELEWSYIFWVKSIMSLPIRAQDDKIALNNNSIPKLASSGVISSSMERWGKNHNSA